MIPLTVRSYYSLMWGTRSPAAICAKAKKLGYTSLALTDTDNLYGLWPFLNHCKRHGLRPIVGAELTDPNSAARAVCLVEDAKGYANLCRLITRRHNDLSFDLKKVLPNYAKGLVVLTQAGALLQGWHESGVNVAGAIPRRPTGAALRLRQLSRRMGVPLVATPGSFFLTPADVSIHRMLRAIDLNTCLSRLSLKEAAPDDAWMARPDQYRTRFEIWPEVVAATHGIAERLTFRGPDFGLVLPPWNDADGRGAETVLRQTAFAGAARRYGADLSETVVDRLEHELKIISQMKFSSYFLVVKDIVAQSPRTCGRGSGAASLVAYCLGITNVCPVKHNLYFERFLNPGRKDPPDIDVDFAWDERDDLLDWVLKKYDRHAALVCNHVTFKPRMAIREVAKVFGLTEREIGQVVKRLPWLWRQAEKDNLLEKLKTLPELKNLDFPEPWPEIIAIAQRIIGIPRYLSVHPGGTVITPKPLCDYVPIQKAPKGVPIIQWEKEATEQSGLVKIDLLGNRSLGVIRDAIANLKKNKTPLNEGQWVPEDDITTQKNVSMGKTMGCFYIESPATRLLQQKAKVGDFEHLVIHSSIIRPAANEFIREYVRRLHGGAWEPIHPLLAGVLFETYGIMVYQEDVSRAAVAVAGFSPAEGDGLRKIMSKKDKGRRLTAYQNRFFSGARKKGLSDDQIETIWAMMMSFSGYSFCKPHSASYARVSFQAAYLKTHHPAEFMAAVISNQGGFYGTFAYVSEAKRTGVKILAPDVNKSAIRWIGKNHDLRVGFLSLKHLGEKTQVRIMSGRQKSPYTGIRDFLKRVRPDEPEARALIHSGAFDTLHPESTRAELLWELARWHNKASKKNEPQDLFAPPMSPECPQFPPEKKIARLRHEFAVLGFLCDRHPMTLFNEALNGLSIVKAGDLKSHVGRKVQVAGLLITGKVVSTKHGDPMEFLTFEDETGLMECTFFPQAYRRFCAILDKTRPFILRGKVETDFDAITLTVHEVRPVKKMQML
jgi:error-prone DNA polymerase